MSNTELTPQVLDLGHGIRCIDTLQVRPELAACYLIERDGELAFVEAGTAPGIPRLLALLEQWGYAREQVRYVIPTHVHLDHAGGVGLLMKELPQAQLIVHPRGARHMIDPSKLIAGATAVYGPRAMKDMYGEILPVEESRVIVAGDGARHPLGHGSLEFVDSPGHAYHHFCIWDETSRGFFTGDVFGLSYRDFDTAAGPFLFPTTTPVQFDPQAWYGTLDRLLAYQPEQMFLTHYSRVGNVGKLAEDLRAGISRYVRLAEELREHPQRHQALRNALSEEALHSLRDLGSEMPEDEARKLLFFDMELNAQGLGVWLDRQPSA